LRRQHSLINVSLSSTKGDLETSQREGKEASEKYENQLKAAEEEAKEWQQQIAKLEKKIKKLIEAEAHGSSSARELRGNYSSTFHFRCNFDDPFVALFL
jgi:chromosome segregation ATPase